MTQRERHTPGEGTAPDATPLAQAALGDASQWGEWYHAASPVQQREAVAVAVQQGVLYTHQLPDPASAAAPRRPQLFALLNGPVEDLQPLHPPELDYHDRELDHTQRDAVARAVATPDVCLIQGFPGTGKSRVAAEIILQAARRGQRVLFLASTPAALDRVLQRLGTRPTVCPIRCLADDEARETLPAGIVRFTLDERVRLCRENALPAARAARDAARQTLEVRRSEQSGWLRLQELAEQADQLADRLHTLTKGRAGITAEVERDENSPPPALSEPVASFRSKRDACAGKRMESLDRLDNQLAGVRAELETIAGKQGHLESDWQQVQPLIEARQGRRFWTGAWWRAVTRSGLPEQVRQLETRRAELGAARQRLEQDLAARQAECVQVEEGYAAECRRLRDEEIARRQAELDSLSAAVSREQDALREQWRIACQTLAPAAAPAELSRQATLAAHAEWQRQWTREERQAEAAEQWLRAVEDGTRTLPDKLADCANVIAATTTALAKDAHFGERNGTPAVLFDLLILDEAHQVTESEFAAVARRARRWVLIGEPQADAAPPGKLAKVAALRPGFFQRLWHHLHADPRRLPSVWMRREGRLICRLRPVPFNRPHSIESERVVDRPDIELRILSTPHQAPQILDVVFPACTTIAEAKQFVFREVDELAVHTRGGCLSWSETTEEVALEFAPCSDPDAVTVTLEDGVRELVGCDPPRSEPRTEDSVAFWNTYQLRFARAAGWTRQRAEQWIADRLGLRNAGRTVLLTVPYRLDPPLARFVSDLLFGGACEPSDAVAPAALSHPPVEFVAVPALEDRHRADTDAPWNGGTSSPNGGQAAVSVRAPRLRSVKGGAGLEMDLADHRPLEQLPAELRAVLPRKGLVNHLEAQALVKRLESLRHDAVFQTACERWRQRRPWPCEHGCTSPSTDCDCSRSDSTPTVAVMALYPAQVELIRHLIRQTPALLECPFSVEVGSPSAFQHRECLLALISLTRSHTHRAVSYGDHPHVLTQALTRAASGLILFGDPGTLARRSQWRGPLDHLDESAAQREGGMAAQLVHYLQGHGPHPAAFHLREGSGV
jgi:hypothetical protein